MHLSQPTPGLLLALAALCAVAPDSNAQAPSPGALPFEIGEQLSYSLHGSGLGSGGHAVMSLTGPVDVRGTPAMVATFDVSVHLALFLKGSVETRSWIDATRFAALRFAKHEHRPLSSSADSVEIYPAEGRWTDRRGDSGTLTSDAPLDELSFIYFLRTLPLVADTLYTFDRFYDTQRSPTTVHVGSRDTVTTPAGAFAAFELEMHVKDPRHYQGDGVIRVWISDDRWRLPIRIESAMPGIGTGVFTLTTVVHGATSAADTTRPPATTGTT